MSASRLGASPPTESALVAARPGAAARAGARHRRGRRPGRPTRRRRSGGGVARRGRRRDRRRRLALPGPGGRVLVLGAGKASAADRHRARADPRRASSPAAWWSRPTGTPRRSSGSSCSQPATRCPTERSCRRGPAAAAAGREPPSAMTSCSPASPAAARRWPACRPTASARGEARAAPAAARIGRRHPRGQHRPQARLRVQGRPARRRRGRRQLVNLTVSDVRRRPARRDHRPHRHRHRPPREQAIAVLHAYDLWDAVAPAIRGTCRDRGPTPPRSSTTCRSRRLVLVTGETLPTRWRAEATELGVTSPVVVSTRLEGEAARSARRWPARRRERRPRPPVRPALRAGRLRRRDDRDSRPAEHDSAPGGPNQEAALAAALRLGAGRSITAVFLDTDGSDGGTELAGALGRRRHAASGPRRSGSTCATALSRHRSSEVLTQRSATRS